MSTKKTQFSLFRVLIISTIIFIFSISAYAIPSDSLKNLVQWKSSEGGNDHWYGIIPLVKPWVEQRAIAESFSLAGQTGYLVSITSAPENQFIVDNILAGNTDQPSVADEFYIGGHDSLGWRWFDGNLFSYTNWASGEPSGDGSGLAIWGASSGKTGLWNDVPKDTAGHGSIHQLWAIVEFDPIAFNPQDSLINLVQWTVAAGGNDHWYGVLAVVQPWNEHETQAGTLDLSGETGTMVSITSFEENQFIEDNILSAVTGGGIADEFYLGGKTTNGWNTGEAFTYTNWDSGEPNGDGIAIAMWGASQGSKAALWNDVPHDGPIGSDHQLFSIVEFGDSEVSPEPEDTLINLVQWSSAEGGNDHWYGIIPIVQPWNEHRALAEQLEYNGFTGYLTTVKSSGENQFIHDNILIGNTDQPSVADEFFIGGYDSLGWGWITGESFNFTNWESGEPSGDGAAIAMWGASTVNAGQWNDVPEDTLPPHSTISQLWAIVEFGEPDTTTIVPDTLINLVQWSSLEGGNDHWYGIISIVQPWNEQRILAEQLEHNGDSGYLATITSPEENQFIYDNILVGNTGQPSVADEFYLGGLDSIGWGWINGEEFGYTNWDSGEPNGDGSALAIWGASNGNAGYWNDVPEDTLPPHSTISQLWAIVEFGEFVVPTYDSLIIESMTATYGSNVVSASVKLTQPIKGASIPIKVPGGMNILSVSTFGFITDSWDYNIIQNKTDDSGFIFVSLSNSFGAEIPVGETDIFNITFNGTSYSCDNPSTVQFDTTLYDDISRRLTFVDTLSLPVYPKFDKNRNQIELPTLLTGDFDLNASIDIADLVALVDYMFNGGPPPVHFNAIDINGDCQGPDIADLVRFVEYMFNDGADLPCGCIESANP